MMRSVRGVTLVEGLVVVAILTLLVGIGARTLLRFTDDQTLAGAAVTVRAVLDDARSRTLASEGGNSYGVHVESASATRFTGPAYVSNDPANETVVLPPSVELVASFAGGTADVAFARLTGAPSATGTVTVRLRSDATRTKTITVSGTGLVNLTD